jgi:hypothetical protein
MTSLQGGLSASGSKRMPSQFLARFWGPLLSAIAQRTWLQAGMVALPVLHLLFGLPTKELRYDLDGTKTEPYQRHAYTWPIPKPSPIWRLATDTLRAPYASTLRLYENGQPVGRPHTPHDDIASKRGGAYSHWNDTLAFTSRDNSDPRTNGHKYHAVATATLTKPVQSLLITLIYLAGALGILGFVFRRMGTQSVGIRDALQIISYRTVTALSSATFREVTRVGLVFVPFALGLSLFVAPHMSVDSQVVAAFELNDFVMPHFGPLYTFFTRIVNFVTEIVLWPLRWQAPSDLYRPHYSGASLRVLMLLQHTITILAISYFAVTIATSFWTRVAVAALLYFQPFLLVFTHSVMTEGLSFALLCAATAELVKFSRFDGGHRAALARFYLFIGAASLIKHVFIVFVGAPLGCVLIMFLNRRTRKQLVQGQPMVEAKHLLLGLVGVMAVTQVVTEEAMRLFDIEPRSAIGRAFVYRLSPGRMQGEVTFGAHQFFRSDAERSSIVEEMKEGAEDDTLRRVIDIVGRTRKPWVDPWNAVERFITTECLADICLQQDPRAVTDKLLNSVARHAIVSADVRLWRDVGLRTLQFVSPMIVDSERAWFHVQFFANRPQMLNETVVGLSSSTLVTYPLRIERDLGVVIGIGYIFAELGGLLGLFAVAVITVRMKQILMIPTTLLASGLIYAIAVSVVTVYLPRYGDVVWLVALLATLVAVLELQARMRSSRAIVGDAAVEKAAVALS